MFVFIENEAILNPFICVDMQLLFEGVFSTAGCVLYPDTYKFWHEIFINLY